MRVRAGHHCVALRPEVRRCDAPAGDPVPSTYTFSHFAASYTPTVTHPCGAAELSTSSRALATESILKHRTKK